MSEQVNHPQHYGGGENVYETIKVIEAWALGFHLGNAVKYISRAGSKGCALTDLKKARWYLDREIALREGTVCANGSATTSASASPTPATGGSG